MLRLDANQQDSMVHVGITVVAGWAESLFTDWGTTTGTGWLTCSECYRYVVKVKSLMLGCRSLHWMSGPIPTP